MTWAGFGNTPQTKPSYLADRYVAHGYNGIKTDFMRASFIPIGDTDATKAPPCNEVVARRLSYAGQPDVTVGAPVPGASTASLPMPGGGTVTIFYNC